MDACDLLDRIAKIDAELRVTFAGTPRYYDLCEKRESLVCDLEELGWKGWA